MLLKFVGRLLVTTAFCALSQDLYATDRLTPEEVQRKVDTSFTTEFKNHLKNASTSKNPVLLLDFLRAQADQGNENAQKSLYQYLTNPQASHFIGLELTPLHQEEADLRHLTALKAQHEWAVICLKAKTKASADALMAKYLQAKPRKIDAITTEYVKLWKDIQDPQPFIDVLLLLNSEDKYKKLKPSLEIIFLERALKCCYDLPLILHRESEGKTIEAISQKYPLVYGVNEKSILYMELAAHLQRQIALIKKTQDKICGYSKKTSHSSQRGLALYLKGVQLNDVESMYNAAILLDQGFEGQEADKRRALELYIKASDLGDREAMCNAGTLLLEGFEGQATDKKRALELYIKAANRGDKEAMYNAGVLLLDGFEGQLPDKRQAFELFRKSANLGDEKSMCNAGALLLEGFEGQAPDKKQSLEFFRKSADLGHEKSMHSAGTLLFEGFEGQEPDKKQAFEFFRKAADLGNATSMCNVAILLLEGFEGQAPDMKQAFEFFRKAANLGNSTAMCNLAILLLEGFEGQAPNKKQAFEFFRKSADLGNAIAMCNLAILLLEGFEDQAPDMKQAFEFFRKSANLGDATATCRAGILLFNGFEGQLPDKKQAFQFFCKAADLGNVFGMFNAGASLLEGFEGQAPDKKQAFEFFRKAANLDHKQAIFNVGVLLLDGFEGQAVDKKQAFEFFLKASNLGYEQAMFNVGVLLLDGFEDQLPDKKQALEFFLKAANLGNVWCMCNAGMLFFEGFEGQLPDKKQALEFFRKAADLGNAQAMHNTAMLLSETANNTSGLQTAEKYCRMAIAKGLHNTNLLLACIIPADTEENKQEIERLYKEAISYNIENAEICYAEFLRQMNRLEESNQYNEDIEEEDSSEDTDVLEENKHSESSSPEDDRSITVSPPTRTPAAPPVAHKSAVKLVKISKAEKKLKKTLARSVKAKLEILKVTGTDQSERLQKTYKDVSVECAPGAMDDITEATELKIMGLITALANGEKRGQFHDLKGYENTYAMNLTKGDRFVFEILEGNMEKGVTKIRILIAKTHYQKLENKQTFPTTSKPVKWSK